MSSQDAAPFPTATRSIIADRSALQQLRQPVAPAGKFPAAPTLARAAAGKHAEMSPEEPAIRDAYLGTPASVSALTSSLDQLSQQPDATVAKAALNTLREALEKDRSSSSSPGGAMTVAMATAGARDSVLQLLKACQTAADAAVACKILVELPDMPSNTPFSDDCAAALRVAVQLLLRSDDADMCIDAVKLLRKVPVSDGLAAFAIDEAVMPRVAALAVSVNAVRLLTAWLTHPLLLDTLARSADSQQALATAVTYQFNLILCGGIPGLAMPVPVDWNVMTLCGVATAVTEDPMLAEMMFLLAACSKPIIRAPPGLSGPSLLDVASLKQPGTLLKNFHQFLVLRSSAGAAAASSSGGGNCETYPQGSVHALKVVLHLSACPAHAARLLECTPTTLRSVSDLLASKYPAAVRLDAATILVNLLAAHKENARRDLAAALGTVWVEHVEKLLWVVLEGASKEGDSHVAELLGQAAQLALDVYFISTSNVRGAVLGSMIVSGSPYYLTQQTVDSRWALLRLLLHDHSPRSAEIRKAAARVAAAARVQGA
jgi:hypothetical protein